MSCNAVKEGEIKLEKCDDGGAEAADFCVG